MALLRCFAVSLIAAGPAGGFVFGLLHGGDPDPNPIGRLVYAFMMMALAPMHAGFSPFSGTAEAHLFNVWPHIAIAFTLIFGVFVRREWKLAKLHNEPTTEP